MLERRRAGQVEQLADEAVHAPRLPRDDEGVLARGALGLPGEKLGRALQPGERILDLVGESRGERLEVEVSFPVPAGPDHEHRARAGGAVEERGRLHLEGDRRVARAREVGAGGLLAAPDPVGERLERRASGKRPDGQPHRSIAAAVEELLGGWIEVQEPTIRSHEQDRVTDGVDCTARQDRRKWRGLAGSGHGAPSLLPESRR